MKKILVLFLACLLALSLSVRADEPRGTISLKGCDPKQVLDIYQKASGLELKIAADVGQTTAKINFQSNETMPRSEMLKRLEKVLSEQAHIKITKTDDKHATVSLEKKTEKP